ncbi:sensor histidine kinase [Pseudonocardia acidicola]|uniref:histidine kinase n=1 Tax=Pseudonocardia acidicola TaxID=2724939 RepID=A0ABX1SHK5_9PSEU|nr:HAMP domain-containing sensor histidine kinase [Pseudonocardia acidicola]NMI00561.1 HAMP domain-containing histidine kinase [Pseudonocardia acidicola]
MSDRRSGEHRRRAPRPDDGDAAWPRRDDFTALSIRVGVVLSLPALILTTDAGDQADPRVLVPVVAVTLLYGFAMLSARLAGLSDPPAWLVTAADTLLSLIVCAVTGGAYSLFIAVLPLVVIAASLREEPRRSVGFALGLGIAFTVIGLLATPLTAPPERFFVGLWWTFYLLATAGLVGVFTRRLHQGYEAAAESRAEAIAERAALVEERDLRARLLESQQARLDGLRVILHEFRTPVVSMSALVRDAASGERPVQPAAFALLSAHARHLEDMLDGLADVALAEGSPIGRVRDRQIRLAELVESVFDGAGLGPERRLCTVRPPDATAICEPQRLRRILVNLTENAGRVSGAAPVELWLVRDKDNLVAEIRDRGPGLPPDQLGLVTRKYTSFGERRGTSGLGLWIVEQLTSAMDGRLTLEQRRGGGLVARLVLPMRWA